MADIEIPPKPAPDAPAAVKLQVSQLAYDRMKRDLETAQRRLQVAKTAVEVAQHQLASVAPAPKPPARNRQGTLIA